MSAPAHDKPLLEDWAKGRWGNGVVAVLGGGPDLPADLDALSGRDDVIRVAANLHAVRLTPVHVVCWCDDILTDAVIRHVVRGPGAIPPDLVSPFPCADAILTDRAWIDQAGALAVYTACCSDAREIILCGIDGYQSATRYFYADGATYARPPLDHVLAFWRQAFTRCSRPERIRAASGPLVEVFGQWVPTRSTSASNSSQPNVAV